MKFTHTAAAASIAIALAAMPTMTFAQSTCCEPATKDWPQVAGNLGTWGYTALTQIDKSNVNKLAPAWMTHVSAEPVTTPVPAAGTNDTAQQTIPIVVDGVMYLDTPAGGVIALDGATGAVKWKWQPSVAANGFGPTGQHRGVSVGEGKVFTTAAGNRVVALNKDTGAIVWAVQPTAADGSTLGTTAKVHTLYHDGLVYQGTNDSSRGSAYALRASDGAMAWYFFSTYPHGSVFTDIHGKTFDAGDTWTTKSTPNDTPNNCYLTAGATAWQHPAIDPELGLVYVTFGNVRSCSGAQNGGTRPGDNLFSNSVVALDAKTGAYKWHFQSVHHDIFDMDNVLTPTLANVKIDGQQRKVLYNGSKSGHQFVLDRVTGKPALPIEERPVPGDMRNSPSPTQPFPLSGPFMPQCLVYQNLGSDIPGLPNRAVPNWNGYQAEPDPDHPGQLKLVLHEPNYLTAQAPFLVGPPRKGCMYDGSFDNFVYLSMTSQNGGADMSTASYSPRLNLRYIGYSYSPVAHPLQQGGNGLRQIGGYQTGGVVAVDGSTNLPVWRKDFGLSGDVSRQNNPLVTATDLLFMTKMDGWLLGMDAATGEELWRFQMGAPSQAGTIAYEINGEQYIATVNMAGSQPYAQAFNGDAVWAFKLGGKALYTTGPRSNPVVVSGSQEAPTPPTIVNQRRPVDNTPGTGVPPNTIYMARSNGTATATKDSTATASMVPSRLTVPVGTTVTFTNPGDAAFGVAGSGNLKEHCATQFFEGKFNFRLQPGESAQYTFDREGEYYYNDCTDPRPVGKVIVTLTPQDMPDALRFTPSTLNLGSANGVFMGVNGVITAHFAIPDGYTPDGKVTLKTPLTTTLFTPVSSNVDDAGKVLVAQFSKADIDNNIPEGDSVPLTVTANFINGGVQKQLTSTVNVKVVK